MHLMHLFILCLVSVLKVPGREAGRGDHAFIDTDKFHSPAGTLPSSVKNRKEKKKQTNKRTEMMGEQKEKAMHKSKTSSPKKILQNKPKQIKVQLPRLWLRRSWRTLCSNRVTRFV